MRGAGKECSPGIFIIQNIGYETFSGLLVFLERRACLHARDTFDSFFNLVVLGYALGKGGSNGPSRLSFLTFARSALGSCWGITLSYRILWSSISHPYQCMTVQLYGFMQGCGEGCQAPTDYQAVPDIHDGLGCNAGGHANCRF